MVDNNLQILCWNDDKTTLNKNGIRFTLYSIEKFDYVINGTALFLIKSPKPIKEIVIEWKVDLFKEGKSDTTKTTLFKGFHSFKCKKVEADGFETYVVTAAVRPHFRFFDPFCNCGIKPLLCIKAMKVLYADGEKDDIDAKIVQYKKPSPEECRALERSNKISKMSLPILLAVIVLIIILIAVFGSSGKKSEWSQLSDEEKQQISDNMDFYDDVNDAINNYK